MTDVTRSFPASCRPGDRALYLSGVLQGGDPVLYVIYCHFCTKYKLICSFYTFCTWATYYLACYYWYRVWPPNVHHSVTYQCILPRRVWTLTSLRSFPVSRRPGDRALYLSGVLRVGDPVLYVIYCHFCTKYKLICSFNTFCTCIHPYYIQKTYKATCEFNFQLGFSR